GELIARFGPLENLYGKLGELGKSGVSEQRIANKLSEGAEASGLGKKLAAIVCDVPGVHLEVQKADVAKIDWEQGVEYMRRELGFKTIPDKIEKDYLGGPASAKAPDGRGQMKLI
ncbi:MAG: hypothetical protein Q7S45_00310, partial [Candidatus Curtissbacteria bacterium]|nr:hypothetical protein [Candidatus Curtissbacteria bacterium]